MKDFSKMEEKEVPSLVIWEKYSEIAAHSSSSDYSGGGRRFNWRRWSEGAEDKF